MTIDEVIKIIENEKECVKQAENCDRDCAKCELVMDCDEILQAFNIAINALKELNWYRSQDLVKREDVMPVVKQHHYLLSDKINSIDYGMFTMGIEQVLKQISKAEPPKE